MGSLHSIITNFLLILTVK